MKLAIAALLLLPIGCLAAPASDPGEDERAAVSSAALSAAPAGTDGTNDAALGDLPRWHTYLSGKDGTGYPYDPRPAVIDELGHVVAIREGDEQHAERWVHLSFADHWRKGDAYFDELLRAGVTPTICS